MGSPLFGSPLALNSRSVYCRFLEDDLSRNKRRTSFPPPTPPLTESQGCSCHRCLLQGEQHGGRVPPPY
ncbi:hypothetical protein GN956_G4427 [Arapaima gigas]